MIKPCHVTEDVEWSGIVIRTVCLTAGHLLTQVEMKYGLRHNTCSMSKFSVLHLQGKGELLQVILILSFICGCLCCAINEPLVDCHAF